MFMNSHVGLTEVLDLLDSLIRPICPRAPKSSLWLPDLEAPVPPIPALIEGTFLNTYRQLGIYLAVFFRRLWIVVVVI